MKPVNLDELCLIRQHTCQLTRLDREAFTSETTGESMLTGTKIIDTGKSLDRVFDAGAWPGPKSPSLCVGRAEPERS